MSKKGLWGLFKSEITHKLAGLYISLYQGFGNASIKVLNYYWYIW